MLNIIWLGLILSAICLSFVNGTTAAVTESITSSAGLAVKTAFSLIGIMTLWLGLMKIAEKSGLIKQLARCIRPILSYLFPDIPPTNPAIGEMTMNMSANMLGLGNAATPFGLKAMNSLQKLNQYKRTASNAMCTFLAINTSSIQLIPLTAIAILAANGDSNPTIIIIPTLLATCCSTIAGISAVKLLGKLPYFRIR